MPKKAAPFIVAAPPATHHQLSSQVAAEMLARRGGEGFIGALQDPLRANVNPASRSHLPVHSQPGALEFAKMFPIAPVAYEVGVGDEHARRPRVRLENGNGFARLHKQRLVVFQLAQRLDDGFVAGPVARRFACPAIDHQVVRPLGHFRIQVVHQHAQRGFLLPALTGDGAAARRANRRMWWRPC
jgi:hypothetical protein